MPQGTAQPVTHAIDVAFRLQGDAIPVDHGYALYAALAHLPTVGPWLHETDQAAIPSAATMPVTACSS